MLINIFQTRGRHPSQGPRDPALILKSGTKIRKSGTRDRDSKLKNMGSGTGTRIQIFGMRDSETQLWETVPGTQNFPGHGTGPVPTPVSNSWKKLQYLSY